MTILLVDHKCHLRTKSFDFVRTLLERRFTVVTHHYDKVYEPCIPADLLAAADIVVFLEFLASRFSLGIVGKRCVYFPMYDNEWGSVGLWKRLALLGMNVVSFSKRVSAHARRCGVRNVLDVKYAFNPDRFQNMAGNPRIVALWERGDVAFPVIKKLFEPRDLDKVVLIRRPAEGVSYCPIPPEDIGAYHVEIHESGFLPESEYMAILKEPGIYIAPRLKEGIGMAFLEQMAMGKCVVAHGDATMDEYIVDGKTGIIVNMRAPRRISKEEIDLVRSHMQNAAKEMHLCWLADEERLLSFFSQMECQPTLQSPWGIRSIFWFVLYWIEGFFMYVSQTVKARFK